MSEKRNVGKLIKLKDSHEFKKNKKGDEEKFYLLGRRAIKKGKFQNVQFNEKELEELEKKKDLFEFKEHPSRKKSDYKKQE